jgi:hypothetical protein
MNPSPGGRRCPELVEGRMRGESAVFGVSGLQACRRLTNSILQSPRSNPSSVGEYAATFSRGEKD